MKKYDIIIIRNSVRMIETINLIKLILYKIDSKLKRYEIKILERR